MNWRYVLNRCFMFLLVIVFAVTLNFVIPRLSSTDPVRERLVSFMAQSGARFDNIEVMVEEYRKKFGLEQPIWRQYLNFWASVIRFDFGPSLVTYPNTVMSLISRAMPWTVVLLTMSILIAFIIGSTLGALMVWRRGNMPLRVIASFFIFLSTVPYYLLALLLTFFFAVLLSWFPTGGGSDITMILKFDWASIKSIVHHSILPALSIVLVDIGFWALSMRGMMVTVMESDFIQYARAKGLRERRILLKYAVRTAILPQITTLALALGNVMGGAVLMEVVFAYPGIGYRLYRAVTSNDVFVIQGIVFFIILTVAVAMFIVDIIYPLLDPRISYQKR